MKLPSRDLHGNGVQNPNASDKSLPQEQEPTVRPGAVVPADGADPRFVPTMPGDRDECGVELEPV